MSNENGSECFLYLENRIPITRDDTRRGSAARTLRQGQAERTKEKENAVQVKQGRRAGTGMVYGRQAKDNQKKTTELRQQFSGLLRFGKHSLICCSVYQSDLRNARRFLNKKDRRY